MEDLIDIDFILNIPILPENVIIKLAGLFYMGIFI